MRPGGLLLLAACTLAVVASTAGAVPAASDVALEVGASNTNASVTIVPTGGTARVTSRNFFVFLSLSLASASPASAKARVELNGGLRWGVDYPDASETCTSTPTTGECEALYLEPTAGRSSYAWGWDVVAPANGTYTFNGEIVHTADTDPDSSNNTAQITIVVDDTVGSGGSEGSGGGGTTAAPKAGAVKLSPARPKAGSTVVASVRVTRGGSPVRPTGVGCTGSIGKVKVKGRARAASGVASCLFRTPKAAKGKALAGSVSFRAGGAAFTKRFATMLG